MTARVICYEQGIFLAVREDVSLQAPGVRGVVSSDKDDEMLTTCGYHGKCLHVLTSLSVKIIIPLLISRRICDL